MNRVRRLTTAGVVAALATAGLTVAAGPASAAPARQSAPTLRSSSTLHSSPATPARAAAYPTHRGFRLEVPKAHLPHGGLRVYVRPGTHNARLTRAVKTAVRQQRSFGVPVRYAGYTRAYRLKNAIVVYDAFNTAHCKPSTGYAGYGGYRYHYNGYGRTTYWKGYAQICRSAYRLPILQGVVLHETGHALNLAHVHGPYMNKRQIMFPTIYRGENHYRRGDINGLRWMANHAQ